MAHQENNQQVLPLGDVQSSKLDIKVIKLEDNNYVVWKRHFINVLKAKSLYTAVVNEGVEESIDQQTLALLGSALSEDNMALVVGCSSAYEAWQRLELIYENKTTFEKQDLLGKIHSYKIDRLADIGRSLMEIQTTSSKLKLLGEIVSDDALMSIIMKALPTQFENFIVAFKLLSPEQRTLNHLISNVVAHAKTMNQDPESIALVASAKSTCNYCKKPGHWVRDCLKLKNKKKNEVSQSEQSGEASTSIGKIVSFMAMASVFKLSKDIWVVDSGSTHHMSPNKHWFSALALFTSRLKIQLGNGNCMYALGVGHMKSDKGDIHSVYYVPELVTNLFSIRSATRRGIVVQYTTSSVKFFKGDTVVLQGKYDQGVYVLELQMVENVNIEQFGARALLSASLESWHRKFNHISVDTIKFMANHGVVDGLKICEIEHDVQRSDDIQPEGKSCSSGVDNVYSDTSSHNESQNEFFASGSNDTVVPQPFSQSTPKPSFTKRVAVNLSKFGPFKAKHTDKQLSMSQPCVRQRISSGNDQSSDHEEVESDKEDNEDVPIQLLSAANITDITEDPEKYEEVVLRNDRDEWLAAMDSEIQSMHKNNVWVLVDRPSGVNIVSNKWIFVTKRKPDGRIDQYKARLVARGFSQVYGFDYGETYAPVAFMPSIRTLFAFAAARKLKIAGFDVKTAFLYGYLDETIYMNQPAGYEQDPAKVCLLKRSLYGLKQSPRQWNKRFTDFIKSLDLEESTNDRCIFFKRSPLVILCIYVDDGLVFADDESTISVIIEQMKSEFEIHNVEVTSYLGFQIDISSKGNIFLHQTNYIHKVLKRYEMDQCSSVNSPISAETTESQAPLDPDVKYREAVGSLMYAAITTRPDIMYAVMRASIKVCNPSVSDRQAVKRIFRYLKDREDYGVLYSTNESLKTYCDADFAGDLLTARSTSGILTMLSGGPIHWRSQAQRIITLSSTEAELVSLCSAVKDTIWLRKICLELGIIQDVPTVVACDNQSTIKLAMNEKISQRTRHMTVRAAYPREQIQTGRIAIEYVRTQHQLADLFTKTQSIKNFVMNRDKIVFKRSVLVAMVLMTCMLQCVDTSVLVRTDPVIWKRTNKAAFGQRVEFKILLLYLNPCKDFDNHSNRAPHCEAKQQCQSLFDTEWVTNAKAIARLGSRSRSEVPLGPAKAIGEEENKKVKKQVFTGIATAVFCYQVITNLISCSKRNK